MPDNLGHPPLPYATLDHTHPAPPGMTATRIDPRGAATLRYLGIVALVLGILLMLGALYTSVQTMRLLDTVNDRLHSVTGNPADLGPTGCPAGDGQCGG
jgi:hypothetical protein